MHGRRNPFVSPEGLPFLGVSLILVVLTYLYMDPLLALLPTALLVLLYLIFRDPLRAAPSVALGVVSPVDGEIVAIDTVERPDDGASMHRIRMRVDSFGTYTARSPVEGKIMDSGGNSLWLQTDEGENVYLTFTGYRFGLPPKAFARFGERLGQGQRCAYLRLARSAELQFSIDGKVQVETGQRIVAGNEIIGTIPSPR